MHKIKGSRPFSGCMFCAMGLKADSAGNHILKTKDHDTGKSKSIKLKCVGKTNVKA